MKPGMYAYGTPRQPVEKHYAERDMLIDIDVQGAEGADWSVASPIRCCSAYVDVFVMPPSMAELRGA